VPDLAVVTIAAKNYLSFVRVLANSFLQHHPNLPFFLFLSDEVDGYFDPQAEPFQLLRRSDLGGAEFQHLHLRYDRKEAATASKPHVLGHLLDRGFERVVFFDPDILILSSLDQLFARVGEHAVVLVPHLIAPPSGESAAGRELVILQSGVYNGGCIGVSSRPAARSFLAWWKERVGERCRHDVARGVFFDQRWLDLAPVFFRDVSILRDPGYDVAYWNLPERKVEIDGASVTVDGQPCRFFHFTGFDPEEPLAVTRHCSRLDMSSVGPAAELFDRYRALLAAAGYCETKSWAYAYENFDRRVSAPRRADPIGPGSGGAVSDASDCVGGPPVDGFLRRFGRWAARR
jgi:hypothetical protein